MIASAIIGVAAAFPQISGVITVASVFLWVSLGIVVVFLGRLVATAERKNDTCQSLCSVLNALLIGILGTFLFALILLAVGILTTSVLSAVLIGLPLFFLTLTATSSVCYVRYTTRCQN